MSPWSGSYLMKSFKMLDFWISVQLSNFFETLSRPTSHCGRVSASLRESRSQASLLSRGGVEEDLVDQLLWRQDGKIPRKRDERL